MNALYRQKIQHNNEAIPQLGHSPLETFDCYLTTKTFPKIEFHNITGEKIAAAIHSIHSKRSEGTDKIVGLCVKLAFPLIIEVFYWIFNLSISVGQVHEDWKTIRIAPTYKGANRNERDPSSYQPVSKSSEVGKLLQSLIKTKMVKHLEEHNLLHNKIHGHHANFSSVTALQQVHYDILASLDQNLVPVTLMVDIKSGFGSCDHRKYSSKIY